MGTVKSSTPGKNALWDAYIGAGPLKHHEVLLELKAAGLYRHWQTVACKEGHDLVNAKAKLRDIFLKVMPETAPLFGLPAPRRSGKKKETTNVNDGTLPLFS